MLYTQKKKLRVFFVNLAAPPARPSNGASRCDHVAALVASARARLRTSEPTGWTRSSWTFATPPLASVTHPPLPFSHRRPGVKGKWRKSRSEFDRKQVKEKRREERERERERGVFLLNTDLDSDVPLLFLLLFHTPDISLLPKVEKSKGGLRKREMDFLLLLLHFPLLLFLHWLKSAPPSRSSI